MSKKITSIMNRYNSFKRANRKDTEHTTMSHSSSGSSFVHCYGGK